MLSTVFSYFYAFGQKITPIRHARALTIRQGCGLFFGLCIQKRTEAPRVSALSGQRILTAFARFLRFSSIMQHDGRVLLLRAGGEEGDGRFFPDDAEIVFPDGSAVIPNGKVQLRQLFAALI